ncbi:MAG: YqhA family protein [Nitrospinae bacterium]|nr:YqhA family protein [Nitrospinota bacterium]
MKSFEKRFEQGLLSTRFVVLIAVLASLATSAAVFFLATVDVVMLVSHILHYADASLVGEARMAFRNQSITHVVEVMDGYLLATILLIFALGLYEIFISPFDDEAHEGGEALYFKSLDDLKNALARVILIILIVKLFEHALQMELATSLDLLAFAGSIALVGLALYLSHSGGGGKGH